MTRLRMRIYEVVATEAKKTSVTELHDKLSMFASEITTKLDTYEKTIQTHAIPNHGGPTTTEDLKKMVNEDFGLGINCF